MMMNSKIAVVTPVYNGEDSIQKAINSLLNQSFKDWLSIIVNDGSTDETKVILEKYKNDPRFIIINFDSNKGRPYARQVALEKVRELGIKYMAMLDADDWYYPDKLKFQYDFMEQNPNFTLLSLSIGIVNKDNELFRVMEPYSQEMKLNYSSYDQYKLVPHASSIIRLEAIMNTNFDLTMKFGEDQDFMRRFLLNKEYVFIPKIGYVYNREDSFSFYKYRKSMFYSRLSFSKLKLSIPKTFKNFMFSYLRLFIVGILSLLRLDEYYFKMAGREPLDVEMKLYKNFNL